MLIRRSTLTCWILFTAFSPHLATAARTPNIVFILADDLGWAI